MNVHTMTALGFTRLSEEEVVKLVPEILAVNHYMKYEGYAACPAWALITILMERLHKGDASWMVNDYGFAYPYLSPDGMFMSMVYFMEDRCTVRFSFMYPVVVDSMGFLADSLLKFGVAVAPILDVPLPVVSAIRSADAQPPQRLMSTFLVRDFRFSTHDLASLLSAEGSVEADKKMEGFAKTLPFKRKRKQIEKFWTGYYRTVQLNAEDHSKAETQVLLQSARTLIAGWRKSKLETMGIVIFGDEYEHMLTTDFFTLALKAGLRLSSHVLVNVDTNEVLAVTLSVPTSQNSWTCLVRIAAPGVSHAGEYLWWRDAEYFDSLGLGIAADGCGSELSEDGATGLTELKCTYLAAIDGHPHDMYVLSSSGDSHVEFLKHDELRNTHDAVVRSKGFKLEEHPPILT